MDYFEGWIQVDMPVEKYSYRVTDVFITGQVYIKVHIDDEEPTNWEITNWRLFSFRVVKDGEIIKRGDISSYRHRMKVNTGIHLNKDNHKSLISYIARARELENLTDEVVYPCTVSFSIGFL